MTYVSRALHSFHEHHCITLVVMSFSFHEKNMYADRKWTPIRFTTVDLIPCMFWKKSLVQTKSVTYLSENNDVHDHLSPNVLQNEESGNAICILQLPL